MREVVQSSHCFLAWLLLKASPAWKVEHSVTPMTMHLGPLHYEKQDSSSHAALNWPLTPSASCTCLSWPFYLAWVWPTLGKCNSMSWLLSMHWAASQMHSVAGGEPGNPVGGWRNTLQYSTVTGAGGILNSKPLSYTSSDVPNLDQVIPCGWCRHMYHCPKWCIQGLKSLVSAGGDTADHYWKHFIMPYGALWKYKLESSLQLLNWSYIVRCGHLEKSSLIACVAESDWLCDIPRSYQPSSLSSACLPSKMKDWWSLFLDWQPNHQN